MSEKKEMTYEDEMKRLEEIVEKINTSNISLTESLKLFEEGEKLSLSISKKLKDFEGKIQLLNQKTKKFEDMQQDD